MILQNLYNKKKPTPFCPPPAPSLTHPDCKHGERATQYDSTWPSSELCLKYFSELMVDETSTVSRLETVLDGEVAAVRSLVLLAGRLWQRGGVG